MTDDKLVGRSKSVMASAIRVATPPSVGFEIFISTLIHVRQDEILRTGFALKRRVSSNIIPTREKNLVLGNEWIEWQWRSP
jgi:hypothetical protein